MDTLSEVLNRLHFNGCFYFSTQYKAPFGIQVPSFENVARFHLATSGHCWVKIDDTDETVILESGDIIIIPHGAGHALLDHPETKTKALDEIIVDAGFTGQGKFVYTGDEDGQHANLVCGHFEFDQTFSHPLIRQLPNYILIKENDVIDKSWLRDALRLLSFEADQDRTGSEANIKRLSEIIFIQILRVWNELNKGQHGFLSALADQQLAKSLNAFHDDIKSNWSVDRLAQTAAMSRTTYAERFKSMMKTSPMLYVTEWRMLNAQRLLTGTNETIDSIASDIGYESTAAFSKAFKRTIGSNPGEYRRLNITN